MWAMFYPRPYEIATWSCVPAPLLILAIVRSANGALKLDGGKGAVIPNVAMAFLGPILALALRCILDWNLVSGHAIWIPSGPVTLLLAGAASR